MDIDLEQADRPTLVGVIVAQREQLTAQREQITALEAQVGTLQVQVATLAARVVELEQHDPPPWAKANRPKLAQPRPARKKRERNFSRRVERPTETVTHAVETCPDCGAALAGGRVRFRRQVIDLPEAPVRVIEHVVVQRRCKACGREMIPQLDLSDQVLGQHRVSLRLMGVIALLREQLRLPLGQIQAYLQTLHGLHLSRGELAAILQTVATRAETAVHAIREAIRQSPVVHADETGWREQGQNRYVWSFSTPWLRYFVFGSRRGERVDAVLGAECQAVLVTDFYVAYDHYPGLHQRCWVHLLRDVHSLREKHPDDAGVRDWATAVVDCYHEAKAMATSGPPAGLSAGQERIWRRQQRLAFEQALGTLCAPFWGKDADVPQRVLCQRVRRYLPELFTFLADSRVPADNNAAERSIRPVVVRRKISGGTRSAAGTLARTHLWTLTDTWQLQGRSLLDAWVALLRDPVQAAVVTLTAAQ